MRKATLFAAVMIVSVVTSLACPNCKEGFEAGSKDAKIGEAYSYSVLYMIGSIFSVGVGTVLFFGYQLKKKGVLEKF